MSAKVEPNAVVQVVMLGAIFEPLKEWLGTRGIDVVRMQFDPEDVPTYSTVLR